MHTKKEKDIEIYNHANETFNKYINTPAPYYKDSDNYDDVMTVLQFRLTTWQVKNFGTTPMYRHILGALEELGELAHTQLKHEQQIRDMQDTKIINPFISDAIADTVIYLIQICTQMRIHFGTLLEQTAYKVMERDFVNHPKDGGESV